MACHRRIAQTSAKLGFPEVTLGLVPGAGGTQRLPRLIGAEKALELLLSGDTIPASLAASYGLIDELVEADLLENAVQVATTLIGQPLKRTREIPPPSRPMNEVLEQSLQAADRKFKRRTAPKLIAEAVFASTSLPFDKGMQVEAELSDQSLAAVESKALRHLFFAERKAPRLVGGSESSDTGRKLERVGIVGFGTMGRGIAMAFADSGISVRVTDTSRETLETGLEQVRANYDQSMKRGRITPAEGDKRLQRISTAPEIAALSDLDVIVEAVFEDLDLKQKVFKQLDAIMKPGAILASNTSSLDIDALARVTSRAGNVIGLHFFSPANVMKLLEVIRGRHTEDTTVAAALGFAKQLRKTAVLARNSYGFIGNRMMEPYHREAESLVLEGSAPSAVDAALEGFGMAMGILAVHDMAGIDVGEKMRKGWPGLDPRDFRCSALLVERGWLGQKTGQGFYRYAGRERLPNSEVEELFRQEASRLGIRQRKHSDEEIRTRCLLALVNEGARVLEEGVALRGSDIDVVYTSGYGFPRELGGPMFWADTEGLPKIADGLKRLEQETGRLHWAPAALLVQLAESHSRISDWSAGA
jgi:3-hydroxyacyl-CoA dehydrogenase